MDNWIGCREYNHPLARYHSWEDEKTIEVNDMKKVQQNLNKIEVRLNELIALDEMDGEAIKALKSELNGLLKNPDPITNKTIRSSFENDIFNLIGKGYVLEGGVSSSRGYLNQALVKYEK